MVSLMQRIRGMRGSAAEIPKDGQPGHAPEPAPEALPAGEPSEKPKEPAGGQDAAAAVAAGPRVEEPGDPGVVAEACAKAGVPELARMLIDAKLPLAEAEARIENAAEIRALVVTARRYCPTIGTDLADEFFRGGATPAEAGRELLTLMAASQSLEIRNAHAPGTRPAGRGDDHGWGAAIEKVFGRKEG